MKSEQIKEITEKATEQLVAALQQGHPRAANSPAEINSWSLGPGFSEALTSYLKAIGRFHCYSLHNVLLIALQKPKCKPCRGLP